MYRERMINTIQLLDKQIDLYLEINSIKKLQKYLNLVILEFHIV